MIHKEAIRIILNDIRPEYEFYEEIDFIESGMLDSFDIITLVTELEEKFNIKIDGGDIIPQNFNSINSIIILVENSNKN